MTYYYMYPSTQIVERVADRSLLVPIPANTGHCPCVVSMLAQRRRRWANIEPTHGQCLVFAGIILRSPPHTASAWPTSAVDDHHPA